MTITETKRSQGTVQANGHTILREAALLTATSYADANEATEAVLGAMARILDSRTLFLARFDPDPTGTCEQILTVVKIHDNAGSALVPGNAGPLFETYCNTVAGSKAPLIIEDMRSDPFYALLPATSNLNIGSYIGVPLVYSDGRVYGTLCGIDSMPLPLSERPELVEMLQIMARLLVSQIERDELNAQLRHADALKDRFLAVVAHDLSSPLTTIIGYSELLLTRNTALSAEKAADYIIRINENGHRMHSQITELLEYSRGSAGKLAVTLNMQPLVPLLDTAVQTVSIQAARKQVEIEQHHNLLLEQRVPVDEAHFHRVLVNILSNAIKFTPPTGTIALHTTAAVTAQGKVQVANDPFLAINPIALPWVFASTRNAASMQSDAETENSMLPNGTWAAIHVIDTGRGIPAGELPHIFDEFRQVRDAADNKRESEGTGLGLAIVRLFMAAMGGYVGVRSAEGHGTCFTLLLPADVSPAQGYLR